MIEHIYKHPYSWLTRNYYEGILWFIILYYKKYGLVQGY